MNRLAALKQRALDLETDAQAAEEALREEREIAALEATVEAKERAIAAAPCARAWLKFCEAVNKSGKIRPARVAFGSGDKYAEIHFRQAYASELSDTMNDAELQKLFLDCVMWYPGQPDTEAIDQDKLKAWIAPYLPLYPKLWTQLVSALSHHTTETAEIYRGKA